jgi:hypothetical protein
MWRYIREDGSLQNKTARISISRVASATESTCTIPTLRTLFSWCILFLGLHDIESGKIVETCTMEKLKREVH